LDTFNNKCAPTGQNRQFLCAFLLRRAGDLRRVSQEAIAYDCIFGIMGAAVLK
jgi:hypothetical protein